MNFSTWTNEQLTARVEELRGIAENPGERTTEELETLAQERAAIDAELVKRRNNAALEALRRQQVAGGVPGVHTLETMGGEQRQESQSEAEQRAQEFVNTRRCALPVEETRALLVSTGHIATPTQVSGINDQVGGSVSSILDMIYIENCEGMSAHRVAYVKSDPDAADTQTEGSQVTQKEGDFDYVDITPESIGCYAQISKQVKKQTPLVYQSKVTAMALKSLRKKAVAKVVEKLQASSLVDTLEAELASNKGAITEKTLRKIVLAYGGEEDVVGGAVLFLNKKDLEAFGDVRGTNEKKAVYEITPDGANPNVGTIRDGGVTVRYCIVSNLTACSGTAKAAAAKKTMFYGDPRCFELDLFSNYEIQVSSDFAITSLMDTIVGDAELGGDVVVNHGFVALTIPATA